MIYRATTQLGTGFFLSGLGLALPAAVTGASVSSCVVKLEVESEANRLNCDTCFVVQQAVSGGGAAERRRRRRRGEQLRSLTIIGVYA